jgi:acetoin utilization deacetylase AcuC-like enzyme
MAIPVFTDDRCLLHDGGPGYPEVRGRLAGVLTELARRGHPIARRGPHGAARERVLAVHDADYVARFERAVRRGDGLLDSADNPLSAGTWAAAWGAVDATLHAADAAMAGGGAFAAVRPPGHHAEYVFAMGFCFFGNAVIAAEQLRRAHGCPRVAILDFDVHHGNGSQHLVEERGDIVYISLHQYPFYPGSGAATERGRGEGHGATLNVPLPAGSDDAVYAAAFADQVLPALRSWAPSALVVSAGFDAWQGDPLGGMRVSREGFASWGRWIGSLAREVSGGRVVALLEGGYDLEALPELVAEHLAGLAAGLAGMDGAADG